MISKGLTAKVMGACRARMIESNFRARAGGIYTRSITSDVLGWVGFNTAVGRSDGLLEINPVVGIRHQALELLIAELLGRKPHTYIPATLSTPVGYVMPEGKYRPWLFGEDMVLDDQVDDMVRSVLQHGTSYMNKVSSLPMIVKAMSDGAGNNDANAYRLPAGYYLLGDSKRAQELLAESFMSLDSRQDLAAQQFRTFAASLTKKLLTTP